MLRRPTASGQFATALALLALCLECEASCASPTLPLPPPESPTQSAGVDADHITLSAACGGAEADAVILIINENPALAGDRAVSGALASACGKWDASVYAHSGDVLELSQMAGSKTSPDTTVYVR